MTSTPDLDTQATLSEEIRTLQQASPAGLTQPRLSAIYCGVPAANRAFAIARDVLGGEA